jgi:hypothetical protein
MILTYDTHKNTLTKSRRHDNKHDLVEFMHDWLASMCWFSLMRTRGLVIPAPTRSEATEKPLSTMFQDAEPMRCVISDTGIFFGMRIKNTTSHQVRLVRCVLSEIGTYRRIEKAHGLAVMAIRDWP